MGKWIDLEGAVPLQEVISDDNLLLMPTASAELGLDLSAPVGSAEQEKLARSDAYRGKTLPHKINLGPPRVYTLEATDPSSEVLIFSASEEWVFDYDDIRYRNPAEVDESTVRMKEEELGDLWAELHREAYATAREEGQDFYIIRAIQEIRHDGNEFGANPVSVGERTDYERMFLANPEAVKVVNEEVLGVLPGVKEAPAVQDLVLYHGGGRKYGVVELEHRPTGEGEALDPVPVLRDTPAIWASDRMRGARNYAGSYRPEEGEDPSEVSRESQVYYLDAPNALVAEVETRELSRRQADATISHLLDSDGSAKPPDALKLYRHSDTEFFIAEHYEPGLVRVVGWDPNHGSTAEIELPPVAVGATNSTHPARTTAG